MLPGCWSKSFIYTQLPLLYPVFTHTHCLGSTSAPATGTRVYLVSTILHTNSNSTAVWNYSTLSTDQGDYIWPNISDRKTSQSNVSLKTMTQQNDTKLPGMCWRWLASKFQTFLSYVWKSTRQLRTLTWHAWVIWLTQFFFFSFTGNYINANQSAK